MFKKFVSFLLFITLLLGTLPVFAGASAGVSGTFTGEAEGFSTETQIKVGVTLTGGVITDVQIVEHAESIDKIPAVVTALHEIPSQMVKSGNADVDTVSGATWTSKGIIDAVNNALAIAGASLADEKKTPAEELDDFTATLSPTKEEPKAEQSIEFDFKQFNWGDSKNKVINVEGTPYLNDTIKERNTEWIAYKTKAVGLDMILAYYFTDDKLYQVRYILDEKHSNDNLFIDDYKSFRSALTNKYGEPLLDNESWQDDSKKDYYKNKKGDALSYGYLTYSTYYLTEKTIIWMDMSADNYEVSMKVQYESLSISPGEADYSGDI